MLYSLVENGPTNTPLTRFKYPEKTLNQIRSPKSEYSTPAYHKTLIVTGHHS